MVHSLADVTPNNTPKPLAATRTPANWLIVSTAGNAAPVRIGDNTTSSTVGMLVPVNTTFLMPAIGDTQYLDLASVYVWGATGTDKVSCLYGTH